MQCGIAAKLRPRVVDLLGGQVRETVPFGLSVLQICPASRQDHTDHWVKSHTRKLVYEAQSMIDQHGFKALKLKAGVFEPEEEIAGLHALRMAFPEAPLRIDPNGAWLQRQPAALPHGGLVEYTRIPLVAFKVTPEYKRPPRYH